MALTNQEVEQRLVEHFGDSVLHAVLLHDILTITVAPQEVKKIIRFLKEDKILRFHFLTDLCGLHIPQNDESERLAVVYLLHNWVDNIRIRIKAFLPDHDAEIDSVTDIFLAANWMERETYDFYGIRFVGHPKLQRILNHDGMSVHPMRKEYPVEDEYRTDKDDRFFGREVNPHSLSSPDTK